MVLKEVKGQENKEEIVQEEKVQPEVQVMQTSAAEAHTQQTEDIRPPKVKSMGIMNWPCRARHVTSNQSSTQISTLQELVTSTTGAYS